MAVEEAESRPSGNGAVSVDDGAEQRGGEQGEARENNVLRFLDSIDGYLIMIDSLSSTLRKGWLELASARHSMGASRINSASLDLKSHSATSTLEIDYGDASSVLKSPQFTLCKWASSDDTKSSSSEVKIEDESVKERSSNPQLRHRSSVQSAEYQDKTPERNGHGPPHIEDNVAQKERSKLLAMFGTLVSPKLRAAQVSFETALETLVEIANMRATMIVTYNQLQKELESTWDHEFGHF